MKSGKQRQAEIKAARRKRREREALARQRPAPPVWRWRAAVPVDCSRLAPYNSYGEPQFVAEGFYTDLAFRCVDCGAEAVWSAERQKWWYEEAKGSVYSTARRCKACRAKERERREQARKTHLEGLRG